MKRTREREIKAGDKGEKGKTKEDAEVMFAAKINKTNLLIRC